MQMLMICKPSFVTGGLSMNLPLGGAIHRGKVRKLETQRKREVEWSLSCGHSPVHSLREPPPSEASRASDGCSAGFNPLSLMGTSFCHPPTMFKFKVHPAFISDGRCQLTGSSVIAELWNPTELASQDFAQRSWIAPGPTRNPQVFICLDKVVIGSPP